MRAMVMETTGGPEVLHPAELAVPVPQADEVLVQVAYAGVNPADWKNREGYLAAFRPYVFPCVIGFDAAGVVAAVGEGVQGLAVGDRVCTTTNHGKGGQGSYAEYVIADADRVARIPDSLGFAAAAALPVASLTAWQALFARGSVQRDDAVLIHGGSGGVGSFAVQLARWAGARVAATCSTPNVAYLQALGVERVIDYRQEAVREAVLSWAPDGVHYLMDAVGASTLPEGLALVRPGGRYVSIATLVDDGDIEAAMAAAADKGVARELAILQDDGCAETLENIAALLADGSVRLPQIVEFDLLEVGEAHKILQRGHTRGKLVLRVAEL